MPKNFKNLALGLSFAVILLATGLISSCGGGGGGITPKINPPVNQPTNGGQGAPQNQAPSGGEEITLSAPDVAKSAGELGGVVVDAEGNAIDDLELYLDDINNFVSSTDEEGKFLITPVNPGSHDLIIGVEGQDVATFTVEYAGSEPVNVVLAPPTVKVSSQESLPGRLVGHVTDLEGNPIPGVKVLVFDRSGFFLLRRTGELGNYEFESIPAGEYFLIGFKRGYRTHVGQVIIQPGETTRHDFQMARLNVGGVKGTVTDAEGNPLPGTHVFLLYRERFGELPRPPAFHRFTDEHGFYIFEGVPSGVADMLAFKPEYEPADAEVFIPPNEIITQNFVLYRHEPPPPHFSSLDGFVYEASDPSEPGQPIAGALIHLKRPDVVFEAETNEDGFYKFVEIPSGPWAFRVSAEGYQTIEGELFLYPGENHKNFFLHPRQEGWGRIVGVVLWGESDDPVAGAHIELWARNPDGTMEKIRVTESDERGYFVFEEVHAGPYLIKAYKGDASGVVEVHVPPGETVEVHVRIFPQEQQWGMIKGLILIEGQDGNEHRVPGAKVMLFRPFEPGRDPIRVTESDQEGFYKFAELEPSGDVPYVIIAEKLIENQLWRGAEDGIFLAPGEVKEVNIFLHPAPPPPPQFSSLAGFVYEPGQEPNRPGPPIPGALIQLKRPDIAFEALTNEDGFYKFVEIPSGGYVFRVSKEGYKTIEGELFLEPDENHRDFILFRNEPPPGEYGKIFGHIWRIIGNHEEFVPGASVYLFCGEPGENNPPIRETTSGEQGYYEFGEVPPSGDRPYFVVAKKEFDSGWWFGHSEPFWLEPGHEVRVDVQLFPQEPPPPPQFGTVFGHIWRMIEGNEEMVPGATVLLFHGEPGENNPPIRETVSGERGYYEFPEVPPSGEVPYFVVAKKEFDSGWWFGHSDPFWLEPGGEVRIDVRLFPPEG